MKQEVEIMPESGTEQPVLPEERRGLVKIANCDDRNRVMDIVFVHGLDGDSYTSWMADAKDMNTFWPKWLASSYPNVGIWTLGYAASTFKWKEASMPLADRGIQVLDLLTNCEIGERPLILITHSMGGIVAKQLLLQANDYGVERFEPIANQTCGIAFIATPHSGAGLANFATFASFVLGTNEQVNELQSHDGRSRDINHRFRTFYNKHNLLTRSYCEMRKLQPEIPLLGVKLPKGMIIVDQASADLGLEGDVAIPLDEDHISICKPKSTEAQLYQSILKFIAQCLNSTVELRSTSVLTSDYEVRRGDTDQNLGKEGDSPTQWTSEVFNRHDKWLKNNVAKGKVEDEYVPNDCTVADGVPSDLNDEVNRWRKEKEPRTLYICGSYGSGKSWFCWHYANWLLANDKSVRPICVRLSGSSKSPPWNIRLVDYCDLAFSEFEILVSNQAAPVLLFLDGLDETNDNIHELLDRFDSLGLRRVVTFRNTLFDGEDQARAKFDEWEGRNNYHYVSICPFDPNKRDKLVRKIVKDTVAAKHYIRTINCNSLNKFTRSPVVLRLLLTIPHTKVSGIHQLTRIYQLAVDEAALNGRSGNSDARQLRGFLGRVACWMFENCKSAISVRELKKLFQNPDCTPKSSGIHGLGGGFETASKENFTSCPFEDLNQLSLFAFPSTEGEMEFVHRSLWEYLVAQQLADNLDSNSTEGFIRKGIYFEIMQFLHDLICCRKKDEENKAWGTLESWFKCPPNTLSNEEARQLRENCIRLFGQWRDPRALELLTEVAENKIKEPVEHRRDAIRSICRILWDEDEKAEGIEHKQTEVVTAWAIRTDRRTYDVGPAKINVSRFGKYASDVATQRGFRGWISRVRSLFHKCLADERKEAADVRINAAFALIHIACGADVPLILAAISKEQQSWKPEVELNLWQAIRVAARMEAHQQLGEAS